MCKHIKAMFLLNCSTCPSCQSLQQYICYFSDSALQMVSISLKMRDCIPIHYNLVEPLCIQFSWPFKNYNCCNYKIELIFCVSQIIELKNRKLNSVYNRTYYIMLLFLKCPPLGPIKMIDNNYNLFKSGNDPVTFSK